MEQAVKEAGASDVQVDLETKKVEIAFDETQTSEAKLKEAIEEVGYDVV